MFISLRNQCLKGKDYMFLHFPPNTSSLNSKNDFWRQNDPITLKTYNNHHK